MVNVGPQTDLAVRHPQIMYRTQNVGDLIHRQRSLSPPTSSACWLSDTELAAWMPFSLSDESEWSQLVDIIDGLADYRRCLLGRADLLLAYQEVLRMDGVDDVAIALEFALDPSEPVDRVALKSELDEELGRIMNQIAAAVGDNPLPLGTRLRIPRPEHIVTDRHALSIRDESTCGGGTFTH